MPSRALIEGPSAWIGADMRGREAEWAYCLSPPEIAEIEATVKAVRAPGHDIGDIRREDFRCRRLGPVLDRLLAELVNGCGFVLLRGVPVEDRPIAEGAAAYWGIGTYFGSARSQNAQGHLLGHVYDLDRGLSATDPLCAAMRPRNARISISTGVTWLRCYACGARGRVGYCRLYDERDDLGKLRVLCLRVRGDRGFESSCLQRRVYCEPDGGARHFPESCLAPVGAAAPDGKSSGSAACSNIRPRSAWYAGSR